MLLCRLLSSCGEWGLPSSDSGFSFQWLLLSTGFRMQTAVVPMPRLQRIGSIVTTHRLSCFLACGMLPGQGSSPCLLRCQTDSLPLSHVGSLNSALSVCESLCSFHCLTFPTCGKRKINTSLFTVAFQAGLDPFISDDKVQRRGGNISENKLSLMKCKKPYSCGQT